MMARRCQRKLGVIDLAVSQNDQKLCTSAFELAM
jgi:hypothetical protein